jgi:hypothetical protein
MKQRVVTLALLTSLCFTGVLASSSAQAEEQMAPINSSGVVLIDLPASSAESIRLDIKQARFASQSVGRLVLDAQGIDFKKGSLNGLGAEVTEGNFDNVLVDSLKLNASAFSFDSLELLNHRRFVLDNPVNATVDLRISEENLNRFFANPKTIQKLEKAVAKKMGNLALVNFSNPSLKLQDKNRVRLSLNTSFANAVAAPMEFDGRLGVENGKLVFTSLKLLSNGVQLPVDVSDVFQKKLNEMVDLEKLGKNNFVIHADSLRISNRAVEVKGTAALTRLDFGN